MTEYILNYYKPRLKFTKVVTRYYIYVFIMSDYKNFVLNFQILFNSIEHKCTVNIKLTKYEFIPTLS